MSDPAAIRGGLAARLAAHPVREIAPDGLRLAAVAVVVTIGPGGVPDVLLTLRPARFGRHAGQYALPGGRLDAGETTLAAALRELHEELGLDRGADAVLGRLDDYATRSGFRMTPFVIWGGVDPGITACTDEVARVFRIPFAELDSDAVPHFTPGLPGGPPVLFSRFPALGTEMYAPTAAILYQFREVALRGRPTRVAHFDQPRFAWK